MKFKEIDENEEEGENSVSRKEMIFSRAGLFIMTNSCVPSISREVSLTSRVAAIY